MGRGELDNMKMDYGTLSSGVDRTRKHRERRKRVGVLIKFDVGVACGARAVTIVSDRVALSDGRTFSLLAKGAVHA